MNNNQNDSNSKKISENKFVDISFDEGKTDESIEMQSALQNIEEVIVQKKLLNKDISLKKKFRFSDFLAEKIITSIAFLSIAIILLIFIFVFRESIPIFYSVEEVLSAAASHEPVNNKPEDAQKTTAPTSNQTNDYSTNSESPERYGLSYNEAPTEHSNVDEKSDKKENIPSNLNDQEKQEQIGITTEKLESYNTYNEKPEQYGITNRQMTQTSDKNSSIDQGRQLSINNESSGKEGKADLKNLTGTEWQPVSDNPRYGLLPLFLGTFKLTFIAILIAAPIGILAALFTAAFAPKWLKEIIKPAIEILAGFPSVVIGFFALMVMATFFQDLFGYSSRLNAFVGGVAMSLAAIPIIYTITEDALTAVPNSYKEASLALGATSWQTAFFVTLPAATPGIFAAVLLGVGRVFGETMIALMATGNASLFNMNPFDSVRALSATIGAEMAEVVFGDTHYNVLFLIGSLLFVFTFILNVVAEFYVRGKLVKRFQGGKS